MSVYRVGGERERERERQREREGGERERERGRERGGEREREGMLLCQYLFSRVCHSMAKQPDWAMTSRTALNINEFVLFDIVSFVFLPLYTFFLLIKVITFPLNVHCVCICYA